MKNDKEMMTEIIQGLVNEIFDTIANPYFDINRHQNVPDAFTKKILKIVFDQCSDILERE